MSGLFAGPRLPAWLRADASHVDLAQLMTLLMFVYYAGQEGFPLLAVAPVSIAVLIAAILWPALRASAWFWLYVSVAVVVARLPHLLVIDNHHYLIAYWCIALFCARVVSSDDPEPSIARNARLLVGLSMAFAVVAKLRSGEFADGAFFEYLLLAGDRFKFFAQILTGVSAELLEANRHAVASLVMGGLGSSGPDSVALEGRAEVAWLAQILSLWTLLIEGAVGFFFLIPGQAKWARRFTQQPWWSAARNGSLLCFALSTYAVATVGGFAWILMILGIAQCGRDEVWARAGYSVGFLLVLVYTLPWGGWLVALF